MTDSYDEQTKIYRLQVSQITPPTADQMEKVDLHIPLKIALYDERGVKQVLQRSGQPITDVLNVIHKDQIFEFDQIASRPVPALLCDFSAPVKLDYEYTITSQLITLLRFAENEFIRWDAVQMLFNNELRRNLVNYRQGLDLDFSREILAAGKYCQIGNRTQH